MMATSPTRRVLMDVRNTLDVPKTPKPSRKTPTPTPVTPKNHSTGRRIPPKVPGRHPVISPLSSPVSPMANLKLLTKVASVVSENPPPSEKYSRRLRSLSFICNQFLEIYRWDLPEGTSETISLVDLANRLKIKKRRVYDVINVVASLNLAVKVCKDRYCWFGAQKLSSSLSNLKAYALQNNFHLQLQELLETSPELNWTSGKRARAVTSDVINQSLKEELGNRTPFDHNRIGVLCQKFIMLFLVAEDGASLSLTLLSNMILTSDIQYKTGVRRLYDVANALEALGLIAKSEDLNARRPSFVYKGPHVEATGSAASVKVECVSDNSIDADSELEAPAYGATETEAENLSSDGAQAEVEEDPPAKKRLVFSVEAPPSERKPSLALSLKDAKPVVLSSTSRLLGKEEAAYYRARINAQCQPTFLLLRRPKPPLQLK